MTTRMLMGLLLFTMLCATAPPTTRVAHAADIPPFSPPWQRTQKINAGTDLCFDATMPSRFYTNAIPKGSGTYANNWQTGQNQVIQMRNYDACSEGSGYLFALNPDGATALRYNAGDTGGRTIAHYPNLPSLDGSVWYSFGTRRYESAQVYYPAEVQPAAPGHLFVSTDAGLTWTERGAEFNGAIESVRLVGGNARALYLLVRQIQPNKDEKYALYFSGDAGATWDKRTEGTDVIPSGGPSAFYPFHYLNTSDRLFTTAGAVDAVVFSVGTRNGGPHGRSTELLSTDGGRTFADFGSVSTGQGSSKNDAELFATAMGLARFQVEYSTTYRFSLSSDGGHTFVPAPLPVTPMPSDTVTISSARYAPDYLFLSYQAYDGMDRLDFYVSRNGGHSWAAISGPVFPSQVHDSASSPPVLVSPTETGTYVLDLGTAPTPAAMALPAPMQMTPTATPRAMCTPSQMGQYFADPAFRTQWQGGEALASNFWGPTVTGSVSEPYREASSGQRQVQYFDKGRMELTDPAGGTVTNGLLANELITGQMQAGDSTFMPRAAAAIPVAGDPDNPGPTYAGLGTNAATLFMPATRYTPTMRNLGQVVETTVAANGTVTMPSVVGAGSGPRAISAYDDATQHNVPQAFADYRNQVGVAAIGLAKSEPFLTTVKVGGVATQVMVQVFERRVLTYTATNPPAYQVEMGNIGQHYYRWRYCAS